MAAAIRNDDYRLGWHGGVSILCIYACGCGEPANNECTYNKLRTEQSTDFKLYIGSDEPFVVFAQHCTLYK